MDCAGASWRGVCSVERDRLAADPPTRILVISSVACVSARVKREWLGAAEKKDFVF